MTPPSTDVDKVENVRKELSSIGFGEKEIQHEIQALKNNEKTAELLESNIPVFSWFTQIDDLWVFRPDGLCRGLDIQAIECDARLSRKTIQVKEYLLLREASKSVVEKINEQLVAEK